MKHAGIHFPENAGGEHPNVETILGMTGISNGCTLICSPSARYWYRQARGASPFVVWRAIPRQGKLPAQLGWNPQRVADECLNLWDEQPHGGREWFLPLNELQFDKENGTTFPGYRKMADNLGKLRPELRKRLGTNVRLMFPGWVPSNDGDHLDDWRPEAEQWDAICLHAYGGAEAMRERYRSYRDAFPDHGIFVGEWNSNHEDHDERASLQMWAEVADADPLFLGATYYIWETRNEGERDLSIWGNASRLALFRDPPVVTRVPDPPPAPKPEPPMNDPWRFFSLDQIVAALGARRENVERFWPPVADHLERFGIYDRPTVIAALATIIVEVGKRFESIPEYGPN